MKYLSVLVFLVSYYVSAQPLPYNGVKQSNPRYIALTNATILVAPGKTLTHATLVIEGDKILEVGVLALIPKEAVVIDCKGKTILPSFIELCSSIGLPKPTDKSFSFYPQLETSKQGSFYWNESIHPEINASELYTHDNQAVEHLQKMGYGFAVTHVSDGISQGTGALLALGVSNPNKQLIQAEVAQFYSLEKGKSQQTYPSSQMGSIALLRQAFYDLEWYSNNTHKDQNISLDRMQMNIGLPFIFETSDKWEILRAEKIAKEFGFSFNYLGSGNEYNAVNELKKLGKHIILPFNFPENYELSDPYIVRQIPLSDLKHWELAPYNPYILTSNGIPFCLTSRGQQNESTFWKNIKKAQEHGLSANDALAALTTEPAKMLHIDGIAGTLEKGKKACFSIYAANPFEEEAKILEVWSLGEQKVLDMLPKHEIAGKYNILIDGKQFPFEITSSDGKLIGKIQTVKRITDKQKVIKHDTLTPKVDVQLTNDDITLQFNIDDDTWKGSLLLHGKISSKFGIFEGDGMLPNGKWIQWSAIRNEKEKNSSKTDYLGKSDTSYSDKLWFPNMAFGYKQVPQQETIIYKNATVWTNESDGILSHATVITHNGKISYVGTGSFSTPYDARVIDAKGKHLTSGIIDEHSHIAISKGVNEGGQAISAEVNIGEVINPDDINIYRQLSGGVTAAQLLHGSANPIGGQSALIKLKWGHAPEEFLIPNAPKFIKCALGENVKQSNWGDFNTIRFPQTRMGVEQVFIDGFTRAKAYEKEWKNYTEKSSKEKPVKDLELEVLCEILNSKRFITCHSYVQSEINMLMHVADTFGFKVNTFTHILEGYKLADKMLRHGVGASTFADWWAYKFEVNDAIPYNAALLHKMGVTVAINSDDAEMGKRLNQEAAKTVKYGGVSEEEAWKMVTLNPAKLLHLDDRMGSLKVGKDADIVLWSDNPLSINAKVEMTVVDGKILYDREYNELMEFNNQAEKARIINNMLAANNRGEEKRPFFRKKTRVFHCDTMGELGSEGENEH
jgi:imidazolonepropionase-like amidohydrolase